MARRIAGGWTRPFREDTEGGIFYGWWMVGAGFLMKLVYALLVFQAFGAYVAVLREEFEWSKTLFAAAFAMSRVESGALGPLQGWMVDRFGPRRVMQIGVVIMALGFFWFSQIDSPAMFVLSFFAVSLGAGLAGFMTLTIAVVKWFERRRATALGADVDRDGRGRAPDPAADPVAGYVRLARHGVRVRHHRAGGRLPPSRWSCAPRPRSTAITSMAAATSSTGQARRAPLPDFTTRQALRTRAFWFVSLGHASAVLIVSAVMVHLIVYVSEDLGYSLGFAGAMVSLMTACMMVGQVGGGFVGDRVNKRLLVVGCMIGHVAGLLLLANATALWMIVVFAIVHGLSWGTRGPQMAAIRADYFGRTSFGTIMGFSSMIVMFGMMLGPIIAGVMADATGSYTAGFTVLAAMAAAGSLFFVLARPPRRPAPVGAGAARPAVTGHTEPARPSPRGGTEGAR